MSVLTQVLLAQFLPEPGLFCSQLMGDEFCAQLGHFEINLEHSLHRRHMETSFGSKFCNCDTPIFSHQPLDLVDMLGSLAGTSGTRFILHWSCLILGSKPVAPDTNLGL